MKYKIETIETELWKREYIVEADSKEEADKKLLNGNFVECLDSNVINSTLNSVDIESMGDLEE